MTLSRRSCVITLLLLTACLAQPMPAAGEDEFPDVCAESGNNLVQNCQFNDQMNGWNTFVEAGGPTFSIEHDFPACDSPKCPAFRAYATDWFIGGVYQQVTNVVPGATYWANVVWMVFHPAGAIDGTVGRRIGIDPTGGTDPKSSSIVWSQEVWKSFANCSYKICRELQVEAVAQNTTITLFVRIEDTWKNKRDEFSFVPAEYFGQGESFWIDDVGMIPLGDVAVVLPTATSAVPTDTPVPPTEAPAAVADTPEPAPDTPVPPTEAPAPATDTPTVEVVQAPTATATATPTRLPTITPTLEPTFEPTPTPRPPLPTRTPRPSATPTPASLISLGPLGILGGGALCVGGIALIMVVVAGSVFLFWLYRMGAADAETGAPREARKGRRPTQTRQRREGPSRRSAEATRPPVEDKRLPRATERQDEQEETSGDDGTA
jgi:hypothetical protein